MKKTKKYLATTILPIIIIACMLSSVYGCSKKESVYDSLNDIYVEIEFDDFASVPDYDNLYYSLDNHQVYYFENDVLTEYQINGYPCKYIGGNLEEIVE